MIDGLKPYPKYKDSGVPWLGEIPEHWGVRRLKTLLRERVEKGYPDLPLLAATQSQGVVRKEKFKNRTVLALKDLHQLKLVRTKDFVISLRSFQGGIEYARDQGIISPAYTILYPIDVKIHGYLAKLFKSYSYIENLKLNVTGIRQGQNIDYEKLSRSSTPLPPFPEQTAIVRFLDWADHRIRRVIRAREKRIKLLEEYKQALINQAVTGKIDVRTGKPYPKYKDSGVEWLGKVPEHWEVKPVKRFYEIQLGKMLQRTKKSDDDFFVPYLKAIHVQWSGINTYNLPKMWASTRELSEYSVRPGDLLVCEGGEGGRCAIVRDVQGTVIIQNALHRVRPREKASNDYLRYCMKSIANIGWFDVLNDKATIAHFTREKFAALEISVPPLPEQTAIVEFLDKQTKKLDTAISATRREIQLLKEFRTRLIADVVTGKLDVREAAAKLPGEPPEEEAESLNEEVKSKNDIEIRVPEYDAVSWEAKR